MMPISFYRIYTIGRGGHFFGVPEVVECRNNKEAVEKAMQLASGFDVEIWDHKRLVTPLPGIPPRNLRADVPYQPENPKGARRGRKLRTRGGWRYLVGTSPVDLIDPDQWFILAKI